MAAKIKDIGNVRNISWGTVGSVAVGIALFGLVMYGVKKLPNNQITRPVKQAADVVKP